MNGKIPLIITAIAAAALAIATPYLYEWGMRQARQAFAHELEQRLEKNIKLKNGKHSGIACTPQNNYTCEITNFVLPDNDWVAKKIVMQNIQRAIETYEYVENGVKFDGQNPLKISLIDIQENNEPYIKSNEHAMKLVPKRQKSISQINETQQQELPKSNVYITIDMIPTQNGDMNGHVQVKLQIESLFAGDIKMYAQVNNLKNLYHIDTYEILKQPNAIVPSMIEIKLEMEDELFKTLEPISEQEAQNMPDEILAQSLKIDVKHVQILKPKIMEILKKKSNQITFIFYNDGKYDLAKFIQSNASEIVKTLRYEVK